MKKFLSYLLVALIAGVSGYFLGSSQIIPLNAVSSSQSANRDELMTAYQKGWVAWFSGYGLHREGMQYMDHYIYGKRYGNSFKNTKEAFTAGYEDGYFIVNNHNPSGHEGKIDEAYKTYYP